MKLAEYRKGLVALLTALAQVAVAVQPYVTGDAQRWVAVGLAAVGALLTVLVPNADKERPASDPDVPGVQPATRYERLTDIPPPKP